LVTSVHCPTNLAGKLQSEYVKYDFIKAHYWKKTIRKTSESLHIYSVRIIRGEQLISKPPIRFCVKCNKPYK
jgi:hypothetical protein